MAENARQEIELTFGGKLFRVRPEFVTICSIEGALNQSARTVGMKALASGLPAAERAAQPEISLTELAVVVYWMLHGKEGGPKSPADVGETLMDDGYAELLLPVGQFLTRAQRGHKEHEKEAQEVARMAQGAGNGAVPGPTNQS